ncbi:MAG: SMI1/KNR4 family protein [Prochloraceae cyanobacterium]|nr:SMI1/KNR4 family protein [Prochloraceae cyanobacterium]
MQKWIDLLQNITLTEKASKLVIISQLQLFNFEAETGIILPAEYKNFCQIFGSGMFGDLVSIHYLSSSLVQASTKAIEIVKQQIKKYPSKNKLQDKKLINWLNSLLIFASDDRGNIAAWDLKSFDELKNTYDIYWIQIDDFNDKMYKITSNFFDFINNFCLGRKSFDFLPEYMRLEPCDSFTSYKAEPFSSW